MIKRYSIYLQNNTTKKNVLLVSFVSLLYIFGSAALIGFKPDQVFLALLFNLFYYASIPTRKFILAFSIFLIFWIIFDSMKAFPNYNYNPVHIKELYTFEKRVFGIHDKEVIFTPNEFAQKHANSFLDVLSGLFYINWMPVPLLLGFYFFRKNKMQFLQFSLAFLFVNLLGFIVYYAYPAAPPWYVDQFGFDLHFDTPGNTAGLSRFDDFFAIHLFHSLYAKSSNVFAAMPSLHSAYPIVVLYFGLKNKLGPINIFFAFFMTGIWFSAVYSGHHYVMDVLAGIICALTGLFMFDKLLLKSLRVQTFLSKYLAIIS